MSTRFLLIMAALLAPFATSCTTTRDGAYGVRAAHEGFVPARTAILPCRAWPAGARFKELPLSSLTEPGAAEICAKLDGYVLEAFNNQPYMKAFSPKFVVNALQTAKVEAPDSAFTRMWAHQADDCQDCPAPPAFYVESLAKRQAWQAWLSSLSGAARNADALLMPFLLYGDDKRYEDRGLAIAERRAGIALLLVSTATGDLLWAGGREAQVPVKRLVTSQNGLEPPPWDQVLERLLTEDLWREYPGRQVF